MEEREEKKGHVKELSSISKRETNPDESTKVIETSGRKNLTEALPS